MSLFLLLPLTLLGCVASVPWTPERAGDLPNSDRIWLAGVAEHAAESVGVDQVQAVDCWQPSAHPIDPDARVLLSGAATSPTESQGALESVTPEAFRVLCRVSFLEQGNERWRDSVCLGVTAETPAVTGCYQWAYYRDMPQFEDAQAFRLMNAS